MWLNKYIHQGKMKAVPSFVHLQFGLSFAIHSMG